MLCENRSSLGQPCQIIGTLIQINLGDPNANLIWEEKCHLVYQQRMLFKMVDTDNSGTISYEELKKAMENYPEIPEVQVRRLFEAVDMNHKGEVEYSSFLAATCSAQQVIGEPTLRTAFSVLDRDSDGVITKEDLMETVGQACSEEEIDQVSHAGGSRLCTPHLHTASAHLLCTPPMHLPRTSHAP